MDPLSKVEFYNGATLLGSATTSPYTFTWSGATAGTYAITAKATDNSGAVTTSSVVNITVNVGFSATLSGANERPTPVTSTATGTSVASFNVTTKIISIVTTYTGLTPTAGHIHSGAATVAGPVTFGFTTLISPITFTTPALNATQEADLMANQMYVNLHTVALPGGEIRGQLIKQ
ncbi:MAG: CHRD domain-containing protein [Chitinophagaceae bacterium]